ncbi:hypothetical protein DFR76_110116 [Nocardia pseudobrasiliensis]|uniref:Uncharacterized protein n=1 Tax=Nocardia pseudobrasiliensis TaxID=45979 RepID=A0A370HY86_9NOCA|nr:hypothetical protein DFR76_110116 [Nocardia pseudobrasiliensis]
MLGATVLERRIRRRRGCEPVEREADAIAVFAR